MSLHAPQRYLCIHGHFYQPPRENPWLDGILRQPSAAPFADWNERIAFECYAPNAAARVLGADGHLARLINNYELISFNVGPTLLAWLEQWAPRTYRAILDADAAALRRFSGHGSALAQVYNHVIMPLATEDDQVTQVRWGIRDFKQRFSRLPEGMWLPETAVDLRSLETLAQHGIAFTILAPHQARRIRPLPASRFATSTEAWQDVQSMTLDTSRPYLVRLPSGKSIAVFFYDGPISRAVAFEHLLQNGEAFLSRLLGGIRQDRSTRPQLVHIATDGETYGHHHKYGEMALSYVLDQLRADPHPPLRLTNYAQFLHMHPPTEEVEVHENTSWSCAHGIERWRTSCGCSSGGSPGFHQHWRQPLRQALDALHAQALDLYRERASDLLRSPLDARHYYIDLLLDRSERARLRYLRSHTTRSLDRDEQVLLWKLLEVQRNAQLMFTSCGWFFDDIAGPEPLQVLQYATRAAQLARDLGHPQLLADLQAALPHIPGNTSAFPDAAALYKAHIEPFVIADDLQPIAAQAIARTALPAHAPADTSHSAVPAPVPSTLYCYAIAQLAERHVTQASVQLSLRTLSLTSKLTEDRRVCIAATLSLPDDVLLVGTLSCPPPKQANPSEEPADLGTRFADLLAAAAHADAATCRHLFSRHFGTQVSSLLALAARSPDLLALLTEAVRARLRQDAQARQRQLLPLIQTLQASQEPVPVELRTLSRLADAAALGVALDPQSPDPSTAHHLLATLDEPSLSTLFDLPAARHRLLQALMRTSEHCEDHPGEFEGLHKLEQLIELARLPALAVPVLAAEMALYRLVPVAASMMRAQRFSSSPHLVGGDPARWLTLFSALCRTLHVALPSSARPH